ncbi:MULTISPECIES: tail fiber assembly protein [unclassified Pseudomonas]|uniref:tail fiber assembly protein n=1 Tax=unclassified Pseudomonas TaxID=196821 RepID=UPI001F57B410|nr:MULTISPECIES: tail fiber assembly protein [unclassified Pseudomonas]
MNFAIIERGVVVNVMVWDGDTGGLSLEEGKKAVEIGNEIVAAIGYSYDGAVFTAPEIPPPTPAEVLSINTAVRDGFLSAATRSMGPLQDAADLGKATADETAMLIKWKEFRVDVNRIDLKLLSPDWPVAPA